ncbi:unnamed protein product [Dimorphilus gyrociliatus]|uniref:F-box/LRR-repeat protein 15-like leucin rich repeat domain-containing protein n=1 Tax=Dimorphilus gyrociliatus TaxID=2664684 RepID=A0A7I8V4F5_9ANNE|nr:unnamed protein product [Dimorphilus gyrociliatus]
MSSLSKACLEISNSIKGFRLSRSQSSESGTSSRESMLSVRSATNSISRVFKSATSRVRGGFDQQQPTAPPQRQRPPSASRYYDKAMLALASNYPRTAKDLLQDGTFLTKFFRYFTPIERCLLGQVCIAWKNILYERGWWNGILVVIRCKESPLDEREKLYRSLSQRAIDSICLMHATDADMEHLIINVPSQLRSVSLKQCNITDSGLEMLLAKLPSIYRLELVGCNELTEAGFWSSLTSSVISLTVADCINFADDAVGAVSQLLPSLHEFNLQAYHVTDAALAYFTSKQSNTLSVLRLTSCWELTNHAVVNIVQSLPNLTVLSLSGCSKITDDGIEIVAETLKNLRILDLSWCSRITDSSLEAIACDLNLDELTLDRLGVYYCC